PDRVACAVVGGLRIVRGVIRPQVLLRRLEPAVPVGGRVGELLLRAAGRLGRTRCRRLLVRAARGRRCAGAGARHGEHSRANPQPAAVTAAWRAAQEPVAGGAPPKTSSSISKVTGIAARPASRNSRTSGLRRSCCVATTASLWNRRASCAR